MTNFIMVHKPFLHLVLGVVLLQAVMVTEAVSQCSRIQTLGHGGCHIYQLLPQDTRMCQVGSHRSPNFSFFLRPGPSFQILQIQVRTSIWVSATFTVQKKIMKQPDRWYHIRLSEESPPLGVVSDYHLYVDGKKHKSVRVLIKGNTFNIFTRGSPMYSPTCDRTQLPPPTSPPPRRLVPPHKAPVEPVASPQTPAPAPLTSTQSVQPYTEDFSTEDSIITNITLPTTNNNAGLPWYIPLSIVVSVVIIIMTIVLVVLVVIRRSSKQNEKNLFSLELGGSSVDQTSRKVLGAENHIYEELDDFGAATHGAASYPVEVRAGGGTGRASLTRSSYNSVNSIYVPFT